MEWIGKILDFIAKFSWAVMIVAAFVLFVPDDAAKQIAIFDIRESYKGVWWIVLVLSGAIWSSSAFKYFDSKFSLWLNARHKEKEKKERAEKRKMEIQNRLDSLDELEQLWIKYCLYNNTQTLSAHSIDGTAHSLTYKGILEQGSGSILDLPFYISDDVWKFLKENDSRYLPDDDRNNPNSKRKVQEYHNG